MAWIGLSMLLVIVLAGIVRAPAPVDVGLVALMVFLVLAGIVIGFIGYGIDSREFDRQVAAGEGPTKRPWPTRGGRTSALGFRVLWASLSMLLVMLLSAAANAPAAVIVALLVLMVVIFFVGWVVVFVGFRIDRRDVDEYNRQVAAGEIAPWKPGDPPWDLRKRGQGIAAAVSPGAFTAADAVTQAAWQAYEAGVKGQAAQRAAERWALQELALTVLAGIFFWPALFFIIDVATNPNAEWWAWLGAVLCPVLLVAGVVVVVRMAIAHRRGRAG